MRRKIGDVFDYNDNGKIVTLKVEKADFSDAACIGCYFDSPTFECVKDLSVTGICFEEYRKNHLPKIYDVVFKLIEEK